MRQGRGVVPRRLGRPAPARSACGGAVSSDRPRRTVRVNLKVTVTGLSRTILRSVFRIPRAGWSREGRVRVAKSPQSHGTPPAPAGGPQSHAPCSQLERFKFDPHVPWIAGRRRFISKFVTRNISKLHTRTPPRTGRTPGSARADTAAMRQSRCRTVSRAPGPGLSKSTPCRTVARAVVGPSPGAAPLRLTRSCGQSESRSWPVDRRRDPSRPGRNPLATTCR